MKLKVYLIILFLFIALSKTTIGQDTSLGDTLGSYNAGILTPTPDRALMGVEFAEGHYWVTGADPDDLWQHKLYKISADGQTLVETFDYGIEVASWKDMAYDGEYLYVVDIDTIRQIDMETGEKTSVTIPGPEYYLSGLAYDAESDNFWVSGDGQVIYEIDRQGNIVNSVSFDPELPAAGLAWDTWSEGGPYLWVWSMKYTPSDVRPQAFQINPQSGTLTGVTFEGVLMNPSGVAADYAFGATITDELYDDKVALVGLHGSSYESFNDQLDWVVNYDLDPEGTGFPGPEIAVDPESIENNLVPGDSVDIPVYISNLSENYDLEWLATLEYPGMNPDMEEIGDTLKTFDVTAITPDLNKRLRGITFQGNHIWISSDDDFNDQFNLYKIKKDGSEVVDTYTLSAFTTDWSAITSDENFIYGVRQYQINVFDPDSGYIVNSFPRPSFSPSGFAYDPQKEHFWGGGQTGAIMEFDKQGEEVNFFVTPYNIKGLAWDRWSPDGPYLWAYHLTADSTIKATRLNPATAGTTGLEFEGVNLSGDPENPDIPLGAAITPDWQENKLTMVALNKSNTQPADGHDKAIVYDLATTPPPGWIELINPSLGTVEPLDSDTLYVRLRAIMEDTLTTAQVIINSNDVDDPNLAIPVNFNMLPEIFTGEEEDPHRQSAIEALYPNPADRQVNILLGNTGKANVLVYNASGILIKRLENETGGTMRINTDNLPAGLYQVVVQTEGQTHSKKLMIK